MRKKLKSEAGLTMTEMLVSVLIIMLLVLMLGTGLQMATRSYEAMVAQSEVELLVSTAVNALADDLRCARKVEGLSGTLQNGVGFKYEKGNSAIQKIDGGFKYISDSYGKNTEFDVKDGRIIANNLAVLPTGAYGKNGTTYKVTGLEIKLNNTSGDEVTFDISVTAAATADSKIQASGEVTVRCLNRKK